MQAFRVLLDMFAKIITIRANKINKNITITLISNDFSSKLILKISYT